MEWASGAVGCLVVKADWALAGKLEHTDPYLVWFDVTAFGGAVLAKGRLVPVIEQLRTGSPRYTAKAMTVEELSRLIDQDFKPGGPVARFEIAPGLLIEDTVGATAENAKRREADSELRRGKKKVVGFIDYGCAFAHRNFRTSQDGPGTRVLALWDQGGATSPAIPGQLRRLQWRTPPDFPYGTETHRDNAWDREQRALPLNAYLAQFEHEGAIDEEACYRYSGYGPVTNRRATHGTHIMDVATGCPNPLRTVSPIAAQYLTQRHEHDIVFVQLPRYIRGRQVGGLLRANVYDGLRYIEACAPKSADIVVNLSYGGYAGPHDGTSVLERAIDEFLRTHRKGRKFDLVIPAGNARDRQLHVEAATRPGECATFHWNNLPDDPSDSFVEIWMPRQAGFKIRITAPSSSGTVTSDWVSAGSASTLRLSGAVASVIFVKRTCQSTRGTMALLAVGPTRLGGHRHVAPYGRWTIEVQNDSATAANVQAWCELDDPSFGTEGVPRQAHFTPKESVATDRTLNGIAHGREPIVVGGYAFGGKVARYSGTGPGRDLPSRNRHAAAGAGGIARRGPEDVAPSDESPVLPGLAAAAVIGTDTIRLSGTSVAAAALTRRLLDGNYSRPIPLAISRPGGPTGAKPPRLINVDTDTDEHPDNDLRPEPP